MPQNNPILSVMVISHNQVHLIGRCLESILQQRICVPWEIVISDDASTDNTWQVIQEYVSQYAEVSNVGANGYYIPQLTCSQINSSDYNPTVTSDRCAVNKANVYMHARGTYCVNIDADDYLLGDDIYQYQIDQLEAHPECSVAMQNIWYQNEDEPVEKGHPWHCQGALKENEILTLHDYCERRLFTSNPAMMMRRDSNLNPQEKYGLLFDDPIISLHHITQGMIICTTKMQYVYVQYKSSIWNQVCSNSGDSIVRRLAVLPIYLRFYPEFATELIHLEIGEWIKALKEYKQLNECVCTPMTIQYIERLNSRYLDAIVHNLKVHQTRSILVLYLCLLVNKYHIKSPGVIRLLINCIQ